MSKAQVKHVIVQLNQGTWTGPDAVHQHGQQLIEESHRGNLTTSASCTERSRKAIEALRQFQQVAREVLDTIRRRRKQLVVATHDGFSRVKHISKRAVPTSCGSSVSSYNWHCRVRCLQVKHERNLQLILTICRYGKQLIERKHRLLWKHTGERQQLESMMRSGTISKVRK